LVSGAAEVADRQVVGGGVRRQLPAEPRVGLYIVRGVVYVFARARPVRVFMV